MNILQIREPADLAAIVDAMAAIGIPPVFEIPDTLPAARLSGALARGGVRLDRLLSTPGRLIGVPVATPGRPAHPCACRDDD